MIKTSFFSVIIIKPLKCTLEIEMSFLLHNIKTLFTSPKNQGLSELIHIQCILTQEVDLLEREKKIKQNKNNKKNNNKNS